MQFLALHLSLLQREAALGLRSTVSLLSAASRCAAELEGHVAHVLEGAPLPVPRNTLAAVYHVEALSLQIEG